MTRVADALTNRLTEAQCEQLRQALTTSAGPALLTWCDREVADCAQRILDGTEATFDMNKAAWNEARRVRDFVRQVIGLDVIAAMQGTLR